MNGNALDKEHYRLDISMIDLNSALIPGIRSTVAKLSGLPYSMLYPVLASPHSWQDQYHNRVWVLNTQESYGEKVPPRCPQDTLKVAILNHTTGSYNTAQHYLLHLAASLQGFKQRVFSSTAESDIFTWRFQELNLGTSVHQKHILYSEPCPFRGS